MGFAKLSSALSAHHLHDGHQSIAGRDLLRLQKAGRESEAKDEERSAVRNSKDESERTAL